MFGASGQCSILPISALVVLACAVAACRRIGVDSLPLRRGCDGGEGAVALEQCEERDPELECDAGTCADGGFEPDAAALDGARADASEDDAAEPEACDGGACVVSCDPGLAD